MRAALLAALRRAVPDFADWCVVDFYTADGELTAVHSGYPDARKKVLILEIRRRYRAERGENGGVVGALASGEPLLYSSCSRMWRLSPSARRGAALAMTIAMLALQALSEKTSSP